MSKSQSIHSYRDLVVWQRAMALVRSAYELSRILPPEELYGLSSQLRRAAVSVPANIAEGHGRVHRGEYVHHLSIARGSLYEVETLLLLSLDLGFSTASVTAPLLETSSEVGRMLNALLGALQRSKGGGPGKRAKRIPSP